MSVAAPPKSARKSAKKKTTAISELPTALEVLEKLIEPFGWSLDLDEELTDEQADWLRNPAERAMPETLLACVEIPSSNFLPAFRNANDAKATACACLRTLQDFHVATIDECFIATTFKATAAKGLQTPWGTVYSAGEENELAVWFGRKAGKPPLMKAGEMLTALARLFGHNVSPTTETGPTLGPELRLVSIEHIDVAESNHRKTFDPTELKDLAESIKQHGILQPLLLAPSDRTPGRLQLVAGERRYRAAKLAGLQNVPAQIIARHGLQASLAMFEENVRRVDLSAIERANAIAGMMQTHDLTQKEMAEVVGCTQGQISNELRLLNLPAGLQTKISSGELPPTLARVLVPFADLPAVMADVESDLDQARENDLSVDADLIDNVLQSAIVKHSRSMTFEENFVGHQKPDPKRRHWQQCTPKETKALDVRECKMLPEWQGKERAFNVELFNQLNAEPLAKRQEKHKKRTSSNAPSSKKGKKGETEPPFVSDHLGRRVFSDSLRPQLANAIDSCRDKLAAFRVCLTAALICDGGVAEWFVGKGNYHSQANAALALLPALGNTQKDIEAKLKTTIVEMIREDFYTTPAEILSLAEPLGVDLLASWKPTADFLSALTASGRQIMADAIDISDYSDPASLVDAWPAGLIPEFVRGLIGG